MEKPEIQLHHLESASVYGEQIREPLMNFHRTMPTIPEDISTPPYEVPHEEPRVNQIMLGLITPTSYDGTTDPREWLSYFNDVAEANLWNDDFKFKRLISCLKGAPLQWYRNEKSRNPSFNFTQFRRGLIEKYTNECDQFLSQINIMRMNQRKDQSLNEYWENKLSLIEMTAPTMSVAEKITHLFNGLNQDLYRKVISKYMTSRPETLEEMYRIIKRADDAMNFATSRPAQPAERFEGYRTSDRNRRFDNSPRGRPQFNQRTNNFGQRNQEIKTEAQPNQNSAINRLQRSFDSLSQRLSRLDFNPGQRQFNQDRRVTFADQPVRENRTQRPNFQRTNPVNPQGNNTQPKQNFENEGPIRRRDLSTVQCWTCGQLGHYSITCPNKNGGPNENQKNEDRQN